MTLDNWIFSGRSSIRVWGKDPWKRTQKFFIKINTSKLSVSEVITEKSQKEALIY